METFTVAFFGHRYIDNHLEVGEKIYDIICKLLDEHDYVEFLVGKHGDFDQISSSTVKRASKHYRDGNNSLILVLPYLTTDYINNSDNYRKYYNEVEISYNASTSHYKAAIEIRNREMVDRADLTICFVQGKSGGAAKAVNYSELKEKEIINIAKI